MTLLLLLSTPALGLSLLLMLWPYSLCFCCNNTLFVAVVLFHALMLLLF